MQTKILPTRINNPCPICSNTTGDCRETGDLILCQKSPSGELPSSLFKFIRPSKDGIWGVYAVSTEAREVDREKIEQFRRAQIQRLAEESQRHSNGLSVAERDRNIRAIAAYVGLDADHKQQLLSRGLTEEQIKSGLFFTVKNGVDVPSTTSEKLAGVKNGKLCCKVKGIACVAFNGKGQATGYQVRDENPTANNKYRWAKSIFDSHLQFGELPLTTHRHHHTVFLTEGILKPYVASNRLNIATIGAAGGQFNASKAQLFTELKEVHTIIFSPDGGDILNPHTRNRWLSMPEMFGSRFKVLVAWWGQITKDAPDIDELSSLDGVQFLTMLEWKKLINENILSTKPSEIS
jgi:hypothetical protein